LNNTEKERKREEWGREEWFVVERDEEIGYDVSNVHEFRAFGRSAAVSKKLAAHLRETI